MLMQIHDEVILEGPEEHKDEALALVKLHMEKPFNDHENLCDVDLNVDGDYAENVVRRQVKRRRDAPRVWSVRKRISL